MSHDLPLGRQTPTPAAYAPDVLVGVPRAQGRESLGLTDALPFDGVDVWNAYELSWLDPSGKPVVAVGQLRVPARSPQLVESKSLKLYLASFHGERLASAESLRERVEADVAGVVGAPVALSVDLHWSRREAALAPAAGVCIDDEDVACDTYEVDAALLTDVRTAGAEVEETLVSHLVRSRCPVTSQPDWASVSVHYTGAPLDRRALLRYLVSFREHDEFHEQCVERIFVDLQRHGRPRRLAVLARFTRRGGLDINPFRSDGEELADLPRVWRQ